QPKPRSASAEARDAAWELVRAAQAIDNPLAAYLPKSATFEARPRPGKAISSTTPPLRCQLECRRADDVSADDRDVIMQLISDNMSALYAESSWGWKEREKKREIFDDRHYFLLARRDSDKKLVGLANIRFDLDFNAPVLYCYELQVRSDCQGQGLGKFLLLSMQIMATRARMAKLMVTVFKANERTLKFFYDMRFKRDETDLGEQGENVDLDYVILSKTTSQ
uniref:N-alpha-acetyltransferase 40 n=3 Tax=Macrostomum lignano TaxID=282301 RepID=A0A1I8GAZ1_9PLAT